MLDAVPKVWYTIVVPKTLGGIVWHKDGHMKRIILFANSVVNWNMEI